MIEVLRRSPTIALPGNRKVTLKSIRRPGRSLSLSAEAQVDLDAEEYSAVSCRSPRRSTPHTKATPAACRSLRSPSPSCSARRMARSPAKACSTRGLGRIRRRDRLDQRQDAVLDWPRRCRGPQAQYRAGDVGFHHYAFQLRSRKDVDALQGFLQELGATIVDPAGEYYDDYYAVFFLDPDGLKLKG